MRSARPVSWNLSSAATCALLAALVGCENPSRKESRLSSQSRDSGARAFEFSVTARGSVAGKLQDVEAISDLREVEPGLVRAQATWPPEKTALIICDMWDEHWCAGAARRVVEMAGRVDEVARELRRRGVLVIHAPSSVVDFYDGTPQRELARSAPHTDTPLPLSQSDRWGTKWCYPDRSREPDMPIDDSDMGCDCEEKCSIRAAWTRQIDSITIAADDAISDNGQEVWNLLEARGIDNVFIAGVHLNMCVLGRPFGIRQMTQLGKNVVLLRDLTDTMYNSKMEPFVDHFEGTDLVVRHVESYWCPTTRSDEIAGGEAFSFQEDRRGRVSRIIDGFSGVEGVHERRRAE